MRKPDSATTADRPLNRRVLYAVAAALGTAAVLPTAHGQPVEEVVVTGSRVITNGFQAPTPVTVVSSDELNMAAPTSLVDSLNQLPQFRGSMQPQTTGVGTTGNVGQSFMTLRNLGPTRTLILLDGKRLVPSGTDGVFDVSLLPESLVQRVEIVTGGASAAYGSDAVSGVVNYVLDKNFTGVRSTVQGGLSERGDAGNARVSLGAGAELGERAHIVFAADYYHNDGVERFADRDWYKACARIANPDGPPQFILECGVHSALFTGGGMIPSGPLAGTHFGPGGEPLVFHYGEKRTTNTMVGGTGAGAGPYSAPDVGAYFPVVPSVERSSGFLHLTYDVNQNFSVFAEILNAQAGAYYASTAPWQGLTSGYTIQVDNAFLPESIRQKMIDEGIDSFPLNRYDYDFGLLTVEAKNNTKHFAVGFDTSIGDWALSGYFQTGENSFFEHTLNNPIVNREYRAADAVVDPATGRIVCRSTLTFPDDGCVPINLFGYGSPSRQALDYILSRSEQWLTVEQDVFEISAAGTLAEGWAGPIAAAFGAGYRDESSVQTVDPISGSYKEFTGGYLGFPMSLDGQLGGFDRGNPQPIAGSYDLWELFAEISMPLVRGAAWANELDLNAAARRTDYSTSGGVTSWKLGFTYEPLADVGLRLRVGRSRDIRAPNISEMFLQGTQGQGTIEDLFQPIGSPNRLPVVYVRSFGNPNLAPEKADTTTIGVIYQPNRLPGFSMSVDYYDIDLRDAIATLGGPVTIRECFNGATVLCDQLHRDADGVLIAVHTPFLNVSRRKTSGIDLEMNQQLDVGPGNLNVRMLVNWVDENLTHNLGSDPIDSAGDLNNPEWQAILGARYSFGRASIYVQERYYSSTALSAILTPAQLDPALNRVDRRFYTDLTINYGDPERWEAFFTINNLFDRDPPRVYNNYFVFGTSGGNTSTFYDMVGRRYTTGVRFNF